MPRTPNQFRHLAVNLASEGAHQEIAMFLNAQLEQRAVNPLRHSSLHRTFANHPGLIKEKPTWNSRAFREDVS